jgi:hypothetical protein
MPSTDNTQAEGEYLNKLYGDDYAWGKRDESPERDHELTHKPWRDVKQVPRLDESQDGEDNRERAIRADED